LSLSIRWVNGVAVSAIVLGLGMVGALTYRSHQNAELRSAKTTATRGNGVGGAPSLVGLSTKPIDMVAKEEATDDKELRLWRMEERQRRLQEENKVKPEDFTLASTSSVALLSGVTLYTCVVCSIVWIFNRRGVKMVRIQPQRRLLSLTTLGGRSFTAPLDTLLPPYATRAQLFSARHALQLQVVGEPAALAAAAPRAASAATTANGGGVGGGSAGSTEGTTTFWCWLDNNDVWRDHIGRDTSVEDEEDIAQAKATAVQKGNTPKERKDEGIFVHGSLFRSLVHNNRLHDLKIKSKLGGRRSV
jgi:hypothetical protein